MVTTLPGNPAEKSTVKTIGTLRNRCVFCEVCYVFIVENTQSYDTNCFSVKVTVVTLINTMVLDLRMGLGLSKSKAIFVYTALPILNYKNRL